jgi:UDP-N-acetylmuramate--alanine ligase
LVGIGGSGLSAIARILLESGYTVSGSDRQMSPLAQGLQASGVKVYTVHKAENLRGADLVVRSSAVPDDNPEVSAARAAGIPVLKRANFLGQLMSGRLGIAIAGTHGKTTTTAMAAWMLSELGQDPSFIIGGVSSNLGTNARAGRGQAFVIEADEYDRMFLRLSPKIAVVTNLEHDHPDCYPQPEDFYQAFRQFAERLEPGGVLLACSDDRQAARLAREMAASGRRVRTYGLERWLNRPCPDYCGINLRPNQQGGFDFDFVKKNGDWRLETGDSQISNFRMLASAQSPISNLQSPISLQVPGQHNVRNALAVMAVADVLGLSLAGAARALSMFTGTGRRFEVRAETDELTVIDDYAHHPTEIRATLAAARSRYPGREIWAVWQPHTYSRTRTLMRDFATSFVDADHVLITEVFPAREADPGDFSARQVIQAMDHPDVQFAPDLAAAGNYLVEHLRPGSVLLVLSAGDADQISGFVLETIKNRLGNRG